MECDPRYWEKLDRPVMLRSVTIESMWRWQECGASVPPAEDVFESDGLKDQAVGTCESDY